jgi:hypothetical protein
MRQYLPADFTSKYSPPPSLILYGFSFGLALRTTASANILGITPGGVKIPP